MTTHVVFEVDGHLFALPTGDVARFRQRTPGEADVGWTVELVAGGEVSTHGRPTLRPLTRFLALPRHLSFWTDRGLKAACPVEGRLAFLASPPWFLGP